MSTAELYWYTCALYNSDGPGEFRAAGVYVLCFSLSRETIGTFDKALIDSVHCG